ncbi:MAG: hypothetical protein H8E14_07185 [Candidatus Marinimicrobia bacterium]|nr:hypothetical protein [Candidatus Neomarinimicrobiota bacterium]
MMNDKDMRIRGSANENHDSESENDPANSSLLNLNAIGQITGHSAESATQSYIHRINTDLLQKPFRKQDLAVKVRELLNN